MQVNTCFRDGSIVIITRGDRFVDAASSPGAGFESKVRPSVGHVNVHTRVQDEKGVQGFGSVAWSLEKCL